MRTKVIHRSDLGPTAMRTKAAGRCRKYLRFELGLSTSGRGRPTVVRLLLADEENEACLMIQDVEGNEFCLD